MADYQRPTESAYADARDYLEAVRAAVGALRSCTDRMDELDGDYGLLRAVAYGDGGGGSTEPDARIVAAVGRIDAVRDAVKASANRYETLIRSLEASIIRMERAGDAAEGDSAVLRYRFAQALPYYEVAAKSGYSADYIRNKVVVAIVHIAPHIPTDWRGW